MANLTRIAVAALLTIECFAAPGSTPSGTRNVSESAALLSGKPGEVQQLKALMHKMQQQLESQGALLEELKHQVAELRQDPSPAERTSDGKCKPEVPGSLLLGPDSSPNASPQASASPTEQAQASATEKQSQSLSKPSTQNLKVYWKEGLRLDSADKSQRLRIGGRIMNDWGFFSTDDALDDAVGPVVNGTEFRRARLYLSGRMYDRVNFKAQYDFSGGDLGFKDVYIGLDRLPAVGSLLVGHFKEPFSLEMQTSSKYNTFMERSLGNVFAPERNSGMMIASEAMDKRLTWALGLFRDSALGGRASGPGNYAVTGRVTTRPWYADGGSKLLHLGLAYSHRNPTGDTVRIRQRPEAHLATRFVDTGQFPAASLDLVGVEAALVLGPTSFQTEYMHNSVHQPNGGDVNFASFYVQASHFLTGEHRPYRDSGGHFNRVKPFHNLGDQNGWGAWEIALRYSQLDLNDQLINGGKLRDLTLGLNWYLNPTTRMMWNYVVADRVELGVAHLFQTRFQVDF